MSHLRSSFTTPMLPQHRLSSHHFMTPATTSSITATPTTSYHQSSRSQQYSNSSFSATPAAMSAASSFSSMPPPPATPAPVPPQNPLLSVYPFPFVLPKDFTGMENFKEILTHIATSSSSAATSSFPFHRTDTPSTQLSTPSDGAQRLHSLRLLPRSRISSLRAAKQRYQQAQRLWLEVKLIEEEVGKVIRTALMSQKLPQDATQSASSPRRVDVRHEELIDPALLNDLTRYWQLVQAEQYLKLDGVTAAADSANGGDLKSPSSATFTEPTLFGLDWQSLSSSFHPTTQHTALPIAPGSTIPPAARSTTTLSTITSSASSHSFATLSSLFNSRLLHAFHSFFIPAIDANLQERVRVLERVYDPDGEERKRVEEEVEEMRMNSNNLKYSNSYTQSSSVDTTNLSSLLHHRLSRIHDIQQQVEETMKLITDTETQLNQAILNGLTLTAECLVGHAADESTSLSSTNSTPRSSSASSSSTSPQHRFTTRLQWYNSKLNIINSKLTKMEAELKRDTYFGVQSTATGKDKDLSQQGDPKLILPSLQIIYSTLRSLHKQHTSSLQKKQYDLEQYQRMGGGFVELASEFEAVQKQIEMKKWSLKELHSHHHEQRVGSVVSS